jgi:transmembrane sensor
VPLAEPVSIPMVVPVPADELAERLSWRLPRLDFSETNLAEACALFNRHNDVQLRIADAVVAGMRITGVFRSDNVQGFVGALESSLGVHVERRDREILLRAASIAQKPD